MPRRAPATKNRDEPRQNRVRVGFPQLQIATAASFHFCTGKAVSSDDHGRFRRGGQAAHMLCRASACFAALMDSIRLLALAFSLHVPR